MTVGRLFRRASLIDLEPIFQREEVWKIKKQQYFLDTILRNWGTPKIYLATRKRDGGEDYYLCIDGKQRLTAIFDFLNNKIRLSKKFSPGFNGELYKNLRKSVQDKINDYPLTIEKVFDASDHELGELFKRLQLGLALNSAERLRADANQMTRFVNSLTKNKFFSLRVALDDYRYAHFAVAAQICLLEISGRIVSAKYGNLEKFFAAYPDFDNRSFEAKKIKEVLRYLSSIFKNHSPEISNRASIISAFILISELMKRGNIRGKEPLLTKFFKKFNVDLSKTTKAGARHADPDLLRYQSATIQAADSSTSIKIRHDILVGKLVNYSPVFRKLLNVETDKDKFERIYNKLESKHGGSPSRFNAWLLTAHPRIQKITCRKGIIEAVPIHVRHSIHHPDHPSYTAGQLSATLKFLESIV